ncbi:MAG: bacterial Ig-like domain-containing protein, partial [Oscillibacter sp.]|nr:bacterial Ig-like domain-containing protein [Oscillibacter sp.]
PPTLILEGTAEDVYAASYKNGVMTFSGQTSKDTVLRAYADGASEAIAGDNLFVFDEDGVRFTANIPVSKDEPQATIRVTATDEAGNETVSNLTMRNADYDVVRGISISEIENLSLPLNESGDVSANLTTELVYHSGKRSSLDSKRVAYSVYLGNAVELDADNGKVTAVRDGMSVIKASYLAENGQEFEDLMTVRVLGETANSIRVVPPTKTAYVIGEELDLTGGQVVIVDEGGSEGDTVELTADMVTGFDNSKTGSQTLYVTYGGAQDSFQVTVSETEGEWVLSGVSVTPPTKTRYLTGDSLNLDGAALTMSYSLGGENKEETTALNELADAKIGGFDNSKPGSQIVTVTYQGKTAQFRVYVAEKELTSVKVETLPTKTMYLVGKDYVSPDRLIVENAPRPKQNWAETLAGSFAACVRGERAKPESSLRDGLEAVKVMNAAYDAIYRDETIYLPAGKRGQE